MENLRKSSDSFRKSSENRKKKSSLVCLYNKQNITCPLVDTNFIFSCSTRYLTSEKSPKYAGVDVVAINKTAQKKRENG